MTNEFHPVSLHQLPGSPGPYCMVGNDWIVTFGKTAINFGQAEALARFVVEQINKESSAP